MPAGAPITLDSSRHLLIELQRLTRCRIEAIIRTLQVIGFDEKLPSPDNVRRWKKQSKKQLTKPLWHSQSIFELRFHLIRVTCSDNTEHEIALCYEPFTSLLFCRARSSFKGPVLRAFVLNVWGIFPTSVQNQLRMISFTRPKADDDNFFWYDKADLNQHLSGIMLNSIIYLEPESESRMPSPIRLNTLGSELPQRLRSWQRTYILFGENDDLHPLADLSPLSPLYKLRHVCPRRERAGITTAVAAGFI